MVDLNILLNEALGICDKTDMTIPALIPAINPIERLLNAVLAVLVLVALQLPSAPGECMCIPELLNEKTADSDTTTSIASTLYRRDDAI